MKQVWNEKCKVVTAILLVLSLCLGSFSLLSPLEADATAITTIAHDSGQVQNGDFESGRNGYSVRDWYLTAMNRSRNTASYMGADENTVNSFLKAYTLKTEELPDGNKVAALNKISAGYVALTSQPIAVTGGTTYWISYDYFLRDIVNDAVKSNREITGNDFHGISVQIRELDSQGNQIVQTGGSELKRLENTNMGEGLIAASSYTDGTYTSESWNKTAKEFTTEANTKTIVLYIKVGAEGYVRGTVLIDNIQIADCREVFNGDFNYITYDAGGGRAAGIAGPMGWTTVGCASSGAVESKADVATTYANNYTATVVTDPDPVPGMENNFVMKYTHKGNESTGYAYILSPSFTVTEGETFSVSFRYMVEGTHTYTPKLGVFFYNADGELARDYSTTLEKGPISWTSKESKQFTVPEGAVSAKVGFFAGRRKLATSDSSFGRYFPGTAGKDYFLYNGYAYDLYSFYFDDVMISRWTKETSKTSGIPKTGDDSAHYGIRKVHEVNGREALQLYVAREEGTQGGVTFYSEPIAVTGGTQYTTSFDQKIEGCKEEVNTYGASYVLRYMDSEGNILNGDAPEVCNGPQGNNRTDRDWTSCVYNFTTPQNASAVQIGLVIGSYDRNECKNLAYSWDNIILMETEAYEDYVKDPAVTSSSLYKQSALFVGDGVGSGMAEIAQSFSQMEVTSICSDTEPVNNQLVAHAGKNYDYLVISTGQKELDTSLPAGTVTAEGNFNFETNTYAGALEQIFVKAAECYGELKVVYVLTVNNAEYRKIAEAATEKWNITLVVLTDAADKTVNWNETIEPAEIAESFNCYEVEDFATYLTKAYEEIEINGVTLETDMNALESLLVKAQNCPQTHEDYAEFQELVMKIETFKKEFADFQPEIKGATIAANDPNQLRFLATAPKWTLTSGVHVKKMGVLVIPTNDLASDQRDITLTIDNPSVTQLETAYTGTSSGYYAVLSLENVDPVIEYTARAYIIYEMNGTEYIYYSRNDFENGFGKTAENGYCTKSVYGIAKDIALKLSAAKEKDMDFSAIGGVKNKGTIATTTEETDISLYDVYRLVSSNSAILESWLNEGGASR